MRGYVAALRDGERGADLYEFDLRRLMAYKAYGSDKFWDQNLYVEINIRVLAQQRLKGMPFFRSTPQICERT